MSVKVKIKHLKPGTVFNAGPVAVRVLEHFADGKTLVITDECIADRPFTCQPFKPNRKFWMFGYHAGRWINYNKLLDKPLANPFRDAVNLARNKLDEIQAKLEE